MAEQGRWAGARPSPDFGRSVKVHIFWEGHNILRNLHQLFDWQYIGQIIGGDFANFCGLLRIYELYKKYQNMAFSNWLYYVSNRRFAEKMRLISLAALSFFFAKEKSDCPIFNLQEGNHNVAKVILDSNSFNCPLCHEIRSNLVLTSCIMWNHQVL